MSNPCRFLKRFAIILFFFISSLHALAQQSWYVFIQAESKLPFYARMGDKVFSSSDIGYLIIPGLHDSLYELVIGFPKTGFKEQHFSITINKKDHGYDLKNNEGEWALYNWQNDETVRPLAVVKRDNFDYGERK